MAGIVTLVSTAICLIAQVAEVFSSAGNVWKYRGSLGPDHWHMDYPHCGGTKQSPISIITDDVVVDTSRHVPIVFQGYSIIGNVNMTLENNGHTVQIDLLDTTNEISGGGLPGTFVARQFHFHWGAMDNRGSEHAINGLHFPMELHIVHYNKKYGNIKTALDKDDGLAVLAFFFTVGRFNPHFQDLILHFEQIKFKGGMVNISSIPLVEFMPAELFMYYRYEGSLTTPPCYESVTWTIFNETIEIAVEQLEKFRTTIFENDSSDDGVSTDISDDYRPVQCMFRRKVYGSHPALKYPGDRFEPRDDRNTKDAGHVQLPTTIVLLLCLISSSIKV